MKLKEIPFPPMRNYGILRMSKQLNSDFNDDPHMMAAIKNVLTIVKVEYVGELVEWLCYSPKFKELDNPEMELPEYVIMITKTLKYVEDVDLDNLEDYEKVDPKISDVVISYMAEVKPYPETGRRCGCVEV